MAGAAAVPGPASAVAGVDAGVRLEVRAGVEHPRELSRQVLPVYVVIDNGSDRGLVIRPQAFHLTATGVRRQAIPPDDLRRSTEFAPTSDAAIAMQALPDGVVGAGAQTEGFLYFDGIARDSGALTLTFALRAEEGAQYGFITVPVMRQ